MQKNRWRDKSDLSWETNLKCSSIKTLARAVASLCWRRKCNGELIIYSKYIYIKCGYLRPTYNLSVCVNLLLIGYIRFKLLRFPFQYCLEMRTCFTFNKSVIFRYDYIVIFFFQTCIKVVSEPSRIFWYVPKSAQKVWSMLT